MQHTKSISSPGVIARYSMILLAVILAGCSPSGSSTETAELYFPMSAESGTGIMNCAGEWVLEPQARQTGLVSGAMVDGLAPFTFLDSGKQTYIDTNGNFPFETYDRVQPFSEGMGAVQVDGEWGFIDTSGKMVIEPQYPGSWTGSFHDGLANVATEATTLGVARNWIFINPGGQKVLGPYGGAYAFSDGIAAVDGVGEEMLSGFIDTSGEWVLQFTAEEGFSPAGDYSEGLFPVADIRKQFETGECSKGFMDRQGNWAIEAQFCRVGPFHNGLALATRSDASNPDYGYINTSGKMVIDEKYLNPWNFYGGCAWVAWDGFKSFGLIDTGGRLIYEYP